jgi:hypothetical protein
MQTKYAEKVKGLKERREKQLEQVQHYETILSELSDSIVRLNGQIALSDRLTEGDLRETRDKAQHKQWICRDEVLKHKERLQNIDEQLTRAQGQISFIENDYIVACTTKVAEIRRISVALLADADKTAANAVKQRDKFERMAEQVLNGTGYEQLTDAERESIVQGYRSEANRQYAMLSAEASLKKERADRLLDSISESQQAARTKLEFHAGKEAVNAADKKFKVEEKAA